MKPPLMPLPEERKPLVEDNIQLVHYILHNYIKPLSMDYEDCFQEGCYGLVKAAIGFDESLGYKFSTYAVPQIIGYVKRYLRDKKPMIKYSRSMMDLYTKIAVLKSQGKDDDEIIKELNIGSSMYFDILNIPNCASLDEVLGDEDSSFTLLDAVGVDFTSTTIGEAFAEYMLEAALEKVVINLSDKYKAIYEEYIYCLYYGEKLNQEYLADKYGIIQAQVSRIIKKLNKVYRQVLQGEGYEL